MQLTADKVTLNRLFGPSGQQFVVPPYQRRYAWMDDQVDALWEDVVNAVGSGPFIGSIVLATDDEEHPQIIDGQQRLTTPTATGYLPRRSSRPVNRRNPGSTPSAPAWQCCARRAPVDAAKRSR